MKTVLIVMVALLLCQPVWLQTELKYVYTKDENLDLTDEFKSSDSVIVTLTTSCHVSCLIECNNNSTCTDVTYSNTDSICALYNKQPCYKSSTAYSYTTDMYRKKLSKGKRCLLLFELRKFVSSQSFISNRLW
jgi:hypothetical protein